MNMNEVTLDGDLLAEKESAQRYLKKVFHFPDDYGENLDALYDCLTGLSQEVIIHVCNSTGTDYRSNVMAVIWDAKADNTSIHVNLK